MIRDLLEAMLGWTLKTGSRLQQLFLYALVSAILFPALVVLVGIGTDLAWSILRSAAIVATVFLAYMYARNNPDENMTIPYCISGTACLVLFLGLFSDSRTMGVGFAVLAGVFAGLVLAVYGFGGWSVLIAPISQAKASDSETHTKKFFRLIAACIVWEWLIALIVVSAGKELSTNFIVFSALALGIAILGGYAWDLNAEGHGAKKFIVYGCHVLFMLAIAGIAYKVLRHENWLNGILDPSDKDFLMSLSKETWFTVLSISTLAMFVASFVFKVPMIRRVAIGVGIILFAIWMVWGSGFVDVQSMFVSYKSEQLPQGQQEIVRHTEGVQRKGSGSQDSGLALQQTKSDHRFITTEGKRKHGIIYEFIATANKPKLFFWTAVVIFSICMLVLFVSWREGVSIDRLYQTECKYGYLHEKSLQEKRKRARWAFLPGILILSPVALFVLLVLNWFAGLVSTYVFILGILIMICGYICIRNKEKLSSSFVIAGFAGLAVFLFLLNIYPMLWDYLF